MRTFNYWLLSECHSVLSQERHFSASADATKNHEFSTFIRRRHTPNISNEMGDIHTKSELPPFELNPDISIYLYSTSAPCGDASMELCMAAQEDSTPWEIPSASEPGTELLDGRAHFSRLGVVRRKPARMDADPTRSKSCSDKLALRQVSSLLSYQTSLLVAPTANAYLAGLVLPEGEISRVGCERSFGELGRMKALNGVVWPREAGEGYGYRFRPFKVLSIPDSQFNELWAFGKDPITARTIESPSSGPAKKSKPSNVSAIWVRASSGAESVPVDNGTKILPSLRGSRTGLYETIINGVRQGSRASSPGPRGASALSRAKLWGLVRDVLLLPMVGLAVGKDNTVEGGNESPVGSGCLAAYEEGDGGFRKRILEASTYGELKKALIGVEGWIGARNDAIQDAKKVLKGWIPNSGDEGWGLNVLIDPKKRKRDEPQG
ncbi:tRNA-specific adenosine deaminase [Aspergillus sclerotialis]|uniref:tRNA-specific adenosine deaminase n=1 Tax=Aspergillus sclerotialis TaxID=2070753 RepID=A0A3A2ZE69_9EURO|nr:tRNA-specific adenosine deaminase [Aspergillus sclerotialis]